MDDFAARSFQRAERAAKAGYFANEIVPFNALVKNPSTGEREKVVISADDGIRPGTTKEGLGKIKPAFPQWAPGNTTGGNASQITDGAAAVLLMTRRKAEELGVPIVAKYCTTAVAGNWASFAVYLSRCIPDVSGFSLLGLAPRIMGIGPSVAIPMVLENAGITKDDVDLFEVS